MQRKPTVSLWIEKDLRDISTKFKVQSLCGSWFKQTIEKGKKRWTGWGNLNANRIFGEVKELLTFQSGTAALRLEFFEVLYPSEERTETFMH